MLEPGLDRHDWETQWQALEPQIEEAPLEALPEAADLVGRMLTERGFALDDAVAREGLEPEIVTEYQAARETADRLERGETVDPGDAAAAINGLRALYDHLVAETGTL